MEGNFERETGINAELTDAMRLARESNFSPRERNAYDRFWDAVRMERTLLNGKLAEGREEGRAEGFVEGEKSALKKMVAAGMSETEAKRILGLP